MERGRTGATESKRESIGVRRRREAAQRVKETLRATPLIVGLDIGSRTHHAWARSRDDHMIKTFEVRHSPEGMTGLVDRLEQLATDQGLSDGIVCGMEPTGHWWKLVFDALEQRGVRCVLVNSIGVYHERRVKHLKRAKGDRRDAEIIAGVVARGDFMRARLQTDETWVTLRLLADEHEDLLDQAASTLQRIRAGLELVLPEYLDVFADPAGETSKAVLRALGLPACDAPRTDEEVIARIESAPLRGRDGRRVHRSKAANLVARLRCQPSFGVLHHRRPMLARLAREVARLDHARLEREAVADEILLLYEAQPFARFLDTIPSVSPLHHALLVAYLGDPRQFDRASCLTSRAGIEPQENFSGQGAGPTAISRRGHGRLREVLHRIVMGLRLHNAHYKAVYKHLRNRERNALSNSQALVALGNRYLGLVYRLCVDEQPFDQSRLEGGAGGPRTARRTR